MIAAIEAEKGTRRCRRELPVRSLMCPGAPSKCDGQARRTLVQNQAILLYCHIRISSGATWSGLTADGQSKAILVYEFVAAKYCRC